MQYFTEFTNKIPLQLIEEAEAEIRAGLLMRERNITYYLREFREQLEKKNLAPLTIKGRMTGVCSFYRSYNIQLPVIPKGTTNAKPELKRKKIPTKDDIRKILDVCDPLERALVLVGVSSGLSVVDISNLKVSDFVEGYDPKTGITTLHLIRKKKNYEFYTFLSPEASKAVLDYLDWRNRKPKDKGVIREEQRKKQYVTTKDGYLFISRAVPPEYLTTKNIREKEELRKLNKEAIIAIYQRLNEEAQTSSEYGEYNLNRSHNMRRFFNSALLNENAPIFFVDFLLGHQLDATHEAYYRASPEKLKDEYAKYVSFLTIEKTMDPTEHPAFIQMKEDKEAYRRITDIMTQERQDERSELKELRAEIEKIKQSQEVTEITLELQKRDPELISTVLEAIKAMKS
jgi:integrase